MGLLAASSAALILISIMLLWTMPADPEETTDQALTYTSIGIYVVGLTLTGPVIYYMRTGPSSRPTDDRGEDEVVNHQYEEYETDDDSDYISDIEREFQALEAEIEKEEQG